MRKILNLFVAFVFCIMYFFVFSNQTNAQIIITEIMYDPEGADTGREWVEIYNSGESSIDVSVYKLFESNTNHRLTNFIGGNILSAGQYAIIADNVDKFLSDFSLTSLPNGTIIFDSAFSLVNTGELLEMRDSTGVVTDSFTYSSEMGGSNTGNSLQRNGNDWIPAAPTPGADNRTSPADESTPTDSGGDSSGSDNNSGGSGGADGSSGGTNSGSDNANNSAHDNQVAISKFKPKINFQIDVGRDRNVLINTPIKFELQTNLYGRSGIRAIWNFGDGNTDKGSKVEHIFDRVGQYNLVVNSSAVIKTEDSKYREHSVDRAKIFVIEPKILITKIEQTLFGNKYLDLSIKNESDNEINIGGFSLKQDGENGGAEFVFEPDTIISKNQTLLLSENTTGLKYDQKIDFLYPNGDVYNVI